MKWMPRKENTKKIWCPSSKPGLFLMQSHIMNICHCHLMFNVIIQHLAERKSIVCFSILNKWFVIVTIGLWKIITWFDVSSRQNWPDVRSKPTWHPNSIFRMSFIINHNFLFTRTRMGTLWLQVVQILLHEKVQIEFSTNLWQRLCMPNST